MSRRNPCIFQSVTLLSSVVYASTCHWEMTLSDRHGHMGESRRLEFSIGNLITCVNDAYLED